MPEIGQSSHLLTQTFLNLLQKLEPKAKDEPAVSELIQWVLAAGDSIWKSMERTFYTLHMRAQMSEVLFPAQRLEVNVSRLLNCFTRSINALLREAHGTESCDHHIQLLRKIRSSSHAVVTFNYDLVTERALKKVALTPSFGDWIYGFEPRPEGIEDIPALYKLLGSVNWTYQEHMPGFTARQRSWADFDKEPGTAQLPTIPFSPLCCRSGTRGSKTNRGVRFGRKRLHTLTGRLN